MNILSYRGPGAGGGVSSALSRLTNRLSGLTFGHAETLNSYPLRWWHLEGSEIKDCFGHEFIGRPSADVIAGHYRYCNQFLWPILHDMPDYAGDCDADRAFYAEFNQHFARVLRRVRRQSFIERYSRSFFVHDYQLAFMPSLLRKAGLASLQISIFWHIPWPKRVEERHRQAISEIAQGLLESDVIGFHTFEYAFNFLDFVALRLPGVELDRRSLSLKLACGRIVRLKVMPLGLDLDFWEKAQQSYSKEDFWGENSSCQNSSPETIAARFGRYVLSVDRCDYTKGVLPRLAAIESFFQRFPEEKGKLTFVQICQRTRNGLPSFDEYYSRCISQAEDLNSRLGDQFWRPLVWMKETVSQESLIGLYRNASVMLINPVRDGLNLTAKEFACSCADLSSPGALLLSRGAGVFHEIGKYAIEVVPEDCEQMSTAVKQALLMPESARRRAISLMRRKLDENTLEDWWHAFTFAELACSERLDFQKELQLFTSTKMEAIGF